MAHYQGSLRKMQAVAEQPVGYRLVLGEASIDLNALIGSALTLRFNGEIHCIACGRPTQRSFQQGYCFPCVRSLAQCDTCIVQPERCHFKQGTCREPDWALSHCLQSHIVYLSNASGPKVGITRGTQVPTRWLDQGAVQALALFRVANRHQSGLLEVAIKKYVSDRTNWRVMLRGAAPEVDLHETAKTLLADSASELAALKAEFGDAMQRLDEAQALRFDYPVETYPSKIVSVSFDKKPRIEGRLLGIKGQYLIFDSVVFNVRRHQGYSVVLET